MHFADRALIAEITARMLLEVKAVLFYEAKPFIFTSGWASPVYIDCRKLIFYPRIRSQLVDFAAVTLGRNAQIEGDVRAGARTLLVEDLTTDGRSKINFCKALREAGAIVEHVFVNFYYDIFPESKKTLADLNVRLHHLATWWDVLALVKKGGHLESAQIGEVEKFMHAPAQWSAAHGGVSAFPSS